MLGPTDYALWIASFAAEVYLVIRAIAREDFFRYLPLNLYMLFAALVTLGQYIFIRSFGFTSAEYVYYYYYTDSFLTVFMYFTVTHLYGGVFQELRASNYVRSGAAVLLVATALFSYLVVQHNVDHLTDRFVVELGQNLYFVGLVLTYMLWLAVLKLRETRAQLIQLVLSLGIYFSATAAAFALRNMFPGLQLVKVVQPLAGTFLPLAWAYTFTKIPEEARLATAQVAMPQQQR